tara:strand:- start:1232 stop:1447 length:216 start_codon:yes stop_codon:yes gene_type:complete
MINKKKFFKSNNCLFRVARDGFVELYPSPHFTMVDLVLVGEKAVERAKEAKVKMPEMTNKWWKIPTLSQVA